MLIGHVGGLKTLINRMKAVAKEAKRQADGKEIQVGFTASYAAAVHEKVKMKLAGKPRPRGRGLYWDPQGKATAKFLEKALREDRAEAKQILVSVSQATGSVLKGMLAAGLFIQARAQERCPVDTGNLKNSAFTRVTK